MNPLDEPKTSDGPRWRFEQYPREGRLWHGDRMVMDALGLDDVDQATILTALNSHKRLLALGKRTVEIITPTRSSIGPDATQMLVTEGRQLGDLFKEWVKAITAAEANDGK